MKKVIIAILAIAALSAQSCKKKEDAVQHSFTGAPVALGGGNVRTTVETDDANHPKIIGISFDKKAFNSLPDGHTGEMEFSYRLALPAQAYLTPFDHVVVDWNPHGHPPDHVYDKPHFDMHFYMMSEHERMDIPEYEEDSTGFLKYPAAAYLPANYIPIPGGEAMMGTHWADLTSPELSQTNPQPFTQTFIYGSYNGNVTFYEPMATLDFLKNTSSYTRDIPQPAKVSKDGFYPTKMTFKDNGSTVDITLHDFVSRLKS